MCPARRKKDETDFIENDAPEFDYCSGPGTISLVGIGSGAQEQLTPQASEAILKAEVVVGYEEYLRLIHRLLAYKEIVGSGMRKEVERARTAIEAAREGKNVAVVSSGDCGVYGMAGLVFELLQKQNLSLPVKVIPGITAANLAAAALGAPLMNDFAVISLSDLLTPWEVIEKRLETAALGDWAVVIYNPKSNKRTTQIEKAREILLRNRPPETPVGIVYKAGRPEEKKTLTTLEGFTAEPIDMSSVIIIGNSQTFLYGDILVTPRGYKL